jgi:hypothetical protein
MSKLFAAFFILVMVLPFTEPWPVCSLTELYRGGGDDARTVPLSPPMGGMTGHALSRPPATAPDAVTPITVLPPLRTRAGSLRVSPTSTLAVPTVVAAIIPPTIPWPGASAPAAARVPLAIAVPLRI